MSKLTLLKVITVLGMIVGAAAGAAISICLDLYVVGLAVAAVIGVGVWFLCWRTYRCPYCGAPLGFWRRFTPYTHCPYCGEKFDKEM